MGIPEEVGQRTGGVVAVGARSEGLEGDLDVGAVSATPSRMRCWISAGSVSRPTRTRATSSAGDEAVQTPPSIRPIVTPYGHSAAAAKTGSRTG